MQHQKLGFLSKGSFGNAQMMQFWKALKEGSEDVKMSRLVVKSTRVALCAHRVLISCVDCSQLQAHLRQFDGSSWLPAKSQFSIEGFR